MSEIQFYKMVASGNDFIVMDNRKRVIHDLKSFAGRVCQPHTGVGADGILVIEPPISKNADFFLRIVNSDGSEAEACGNGYRCVGLYAHEILEYPKTMNLETLAGNIHVEIKKSTIKVRMAEPKNYEPGVDIPINGRTLTMDFIDTGVPHVVIFSEGLLEIPVFELGRQIRYHERFRPKGTNVNFAEVTSPNRLRIRTYERGVENETLACGTGSVAAAICSVLTNRTKRPVEVETKSGEALKICFDLDQGKPTHVYLEGSAEFVYEGKLLLKD